MRARLSICPRVSTLLGAVFAVAALLSRKPASAQRVSVDVSAAEGSTATVDVENGYDFAVKAVNVRLGFNAPDALKHGWVELAALSARSTSSGRTARPCRRAWI